MAAQRSEDMSERAVSGDDADQAEIARRAHQLCRRAEPHTEVVPCAVHLHEAQRQLLGPPE